MPPPFREVVLREQLAEAKDENTENNVHERKQAQINLLTKEVSYLLKLVRDAGI